ncbi:MAG: Asp-tRNA(Asn)/Glu-tRNA(Gln) amidotransferase subunit GatC [Ferruginibacter sp.]
MQKAVTLNRYFCLMEVNETLIDKLANLAKLEFDPVQKQQIKTDLQQMIHFINKLEEVNTDDVLPLLHINDNVNVMRNDFVEVNINQGEALNNAPVQDGTFFKVPKVIKK